jgi:Cof subfamily protein (haloacid dehalogenase superfamily)
VTAIGRSRAAGIPVIIVTGRMFRSVRPYLEQAGIEEPVVCYQGAAVVDPRSGEFILHRPIAVADARRGLDALLEAGYTPNDYVDDELFVERHTEASRRYADFQGLPVHEVGDLKAWLDRPPTKLVAIGDPERVAELRDELRARFAGRLFVTTSLPWFLELGHPEVSKATGLAFVADRLGFARARTVAFGDGENDVELLDWAGFGVAVETGHPALLERADLTCLGPAEHGVAAVIEAFLDSTS